MKLHSIKEFDPTEVARLETSMWQAYYSHRFFKLFLIVLELIKKHFHLNYFLTLKASFYLAISAMHFRLGRGRENERRIKKNLTKFYKIVNKYSLEKFDYKKTAELELKWWLIDRYPYKYETTRRDAIGEEASVLYSIEPDKLKNYAHFRASAMELYDKNEKNVDWNEVERYLAKSFDSLHKAVNA